MKCEICEEEESRCYCNKCSECRSKNVIYVDDGVGCRPNILCKNCGNWD